MPNRVFHQRSSLQCFVAAERHLALPGIPDARTLQRHLLPGDHAVAPLCAPAERFAIGVGSLPGTRDTIYLPAHHLLSYLGEGCHR